MNGYVVALSKGMVVVPNGDDANEASLIATIIQPKENANNKALVATMQANIMKYGYIFDEAALTALSKAPKSFIVKMNESLITYLKILFGDSYEYKPFYKNFPREVMDMSNCELFWNAILHYLTNGDFVPESEEILRPYNMETGNKYTIIRLATEEEFDSIFTKLCSINSSLTPMDKAIVEWFANSRRELKLPNEVPFKETLCLLASLYVPGLPVKTATDVLRIAVHMSGGDVSLPAMPKKYKIVWGHKQKNEARNAFKFGKFNRLERRYILSLLENSNADVTEMALKRERWLRLGEALHPGEYRDRFPKAFDLFHILRNQKIVTWNSSLKTEMKKSLAHGLLFIKQRPGEFARQLDAILRKNVNEKDFILSEFTSVADKVSNKVLFELASHFEGRDKTTKRSIMIKGKRNRKKISDLVALPERLIEDVQMSIYNTLYKKFKKESALNKCWLDPELKKIPLPSNMRDMSLTNKSTVRGVRMPFDNPDAKVIRAYVHWFDTAGTIDIDLSAFLADEKGNFCTISYSNLRLEKDIVVHSGDVRHRIGPCAEYIDIDVAKTLAYGYRYCLVDVRNFDGRSLKVVEPSFGFMEREHPESNKIWYPETVSNAFLLDSQSSNTLVCILDLETKEYIMVDIDSNGKTFASGDQIKLMETIKYYSQPPKFSLYDLLKLHVSARGTEVKDKENANTVFRFEDYVHNYEKIVELMGVK